MTDNELIAEFMEAKVHQKWGEYVEVTYFAPQRGNASPFGPDEATKERIRLAEAKNLWQPKYSTSWDWLMPVVEKISKLYYPHGMEENQLYNVEFAHDLLNLQIDAPIEDVYHEVVRSIQWYNQTKKP